MRLRTSLRRRWAEGRGASGGRCSVLLVLAGFPFCGGRPGSCSATGWMSGRAQPFRSPRHAASRLCRCRAALAPLKWIGAGPGPYGLMYREDLALNINRVLLQELLLTLPPWAFPSPPALMLTPRSSSQMASRRLTNVPVIKKPLFSKPFHSLFF